MHRTLTALLVLAIGFAVAFALVDFDRRAINWERFVGVGLVVLPVLVAVIALEARRWRSAGIAYTAAASLVEALALALPAALLLLFIGLSQSRTQVQEALLLAGYTLVLVALAITALTAFFRLPTAERQYGVLVVSGLGVAVYLASSWGAMRTFKLDNSQTRTVSIREYNDRQARKTVAAIADCATRFARAHPARGLPASLPALASLGCLPSSLVATDERARNGAGSNGYRFYYFPDPPYAEGTPQRFAICARPSSPGDSGSLVIGLNPVGLTRELPATINQTQSSCFLAWAGDDDASYLQAFSACLMSGAALDSGRGYPPYPFVGDDLAGACDVGEARGAPGGRLVTRRGVLEYLPAFRDGRGRVTAYTTLLFSARSGSGAIGIDQRGNLQEGLHPNVAATLEAVEAARPAEAIKAERLALRRAQWSQACESGDLEICESLGDFEWEVSEPEQARRWWDYACERGRLQSCLLGSRYNPLMDPQQGRADKERCLNGEEHYCQRLAELVVLLRPRIEELRARGGMPSVTVRGNLTPPNRQ
jgi:hypothetical protein